MESSSAVAADATMPLVRPRHRMSTRNRLLFFLTAWLIVLMPFLFWWNTWFGRALSYREVNKYLHDDAHPRHIQHALVQIGERMGRGDRGAAQWYPRVTELATYSVEQVRNTDAWVMGQDTGNPAFHQALLAMLNDASPMVRGNAALSLVRFGDATGRPQIVALLQPAGITAPQAGKVMDASAPGTTIHEGGIVLKLHNGRQTVEVRSPFTGRLRSLAAGVGQQVEGGAVIATVEPGSEQVWEALRALYVVGQAEDLPAIAPYQRELPDIPDHVRQQAVRTAEAIRQRIK